MKQERAQKPARASAIRRTEQEQQGAPQGRQEVREDVRKAWWPEP